MKESSELFELCRQVHESTGWDDTECSILKYSHGTEIHEKINQSRIIPGQEGRVSPLYTSDYLLEKLPVHLKEGTLSSLYELDEDGRPWCWGYHYDDKRVKLANGYYAQGWADTPLKALLNLVIKLNNGGVKL